MAVVKRLVMSHSLSSEILSTSLNELTD